MVFTPAHSLITVVSSCMEPKTVTEFKLLIATSTRVSSRMDSNRGRVLCGPRESITAETSAKASNTATDNGSTTSTEKSIKDSSKTTKNQE